MIAPCPTRCWIRRVSGWRQTPQIEARHLLADARRCGYFGLTSRRWQSGSSIDVQGRIPKAGDADVRRALYEAAWGLMTRFKGRVNSWGREIAKRSCHRKVCAAL